MIDKNLSFYVLMQHPEFRKAVEDDDTKAFEKIIHSFGVDTNEPYQIVTCEHRPLPNKSLKWTGPRVEGAERRDQQWLQSEYCSQENKYDCVSDPTLRAELKSMSRQSSSEKAFVDESAGAEAVKYDKQQQKFDKE